MMQQSILLLAHLHYCMGQWTKKVPSYSVFHILVENTFMNHPVSLSAKFLIGTSLKTLFLILVFLFLFPLQQVQEQEYMK